MFVKDEHVSINRGNNVIGETFGLANQLLQGILTNSKWRKPTGYRIRGLVKYFRAFYLIVRNKDNFQGTRSSPSYFLYAKPINHTCSKEI